MASLTEGLNLGDALKYEMDNLYSREEVVVLAGSGAVRTLTVGDVVGIRNAVSGVGSADAGNTGDGAVNGAVTLGAAAQNGVYVLTCTAESANEGTFQVQAPDGSLLTDLTVATAYSTSATHFSWTLADGAEDFDIGDIVYITVGDGKVVALDLSATDGSQVAAGVMFATAEAADGTDGEGVIVARNAVVSAEGITWPSAITDNQKLAGITQLGNAGILVRTGA